MWRRRSNRQSFRDVRDIRHEEEDPVREKTDSADEYFHILFDEEESESETDLESLDEQDLLCATDDKEHEVMSSLREGATKPRRFQKKIDNGRENGVMDLLGPDDITNVFSLINLAKMFCET